MDIKELFDLNEKLESRINAYWTYWSVAIFAIAGWLFSGNKGLSFSQRSAISVGALTFFLANLGVIWPATKLAVGLRDEIRLNPQAKSFGSPKLVEALSGDSGTYRLELTIILHLVVDCVVILALLFL